MDTKWIILAAAVGGGWYLLRSRGIGGVGFNGLGGAGFGGAVPEGGFEPPITLPRTTSSRTTSTPTTRTPTTRTPTTGTPTTTRTPATISSVSTGYHTAADTRTANTVGAPGTGTTPVAPRVSSTSPTTGTYSAPGPVYTGEVSRDSTYANLAPSAIGTTWYDPSRPVVGMDGFSVGSGSHVDLRGISGTTIPSSTPSTTTIRTTTPTTGTYVPEYKRWDG